MVKARRLKPYFIPHPNDGIGKGVVVPVAVLTGSYILLTRTLPAIAPDLFGKLAEMIKETLRTISPFYASQKAVADALGLPAPDPVFGQWGNAINDVVNVFVPNIWISITKTHASIGDSFGIGAANLKPNTMFHYGWKPQGSWPGYVQDFTATPKGDWLGPGPVIISTDTPSGNHKIYIDQREFGGKYAEINFEVTFGGF